MVPPVVPASVLGIQDPAFKAQRFQRSRIPFRKVGPYAVAYRGTRPIYFNETATNLLERLSSSCSEEDLVHESFSQGDWESLDYAEARSSLRGFLTQGVANGIIDAERPLVSQAPSTPLQTSIDSSFLDGGCATSVQLPTTRSLESTVAAYAWEHRLIRKMHIELTYRCNYRCIHCYNPHHKGLETELSFDHWSSILRQLSNRGCSMLTLTGGELFVRKDAADLIELAAAYGFTIRLNTNGSLLNDRHIERFESVRSFIQSFDISFYGADAESHDHIAQNRGSYAKTLNAAVLLHSMGWPLVAKFITTRSNFTGLAKFERDMKTLGIPHIVHTGSLIPRTDRNTAPLVQLLTDDQYTSLVTMKGHPNGGDDPGSCRPGFVRGAITPDGKVSPCEWLTDIPFGSLLDSDLDTIWTGTSAREFRSIFDKNESDCSPCSLRGGCSRCPAHSYLETGSLLSCAPIQKHNAELYLEYAAEVNQ